jgi:homoserine kinase
VSPSAPREVRVRVPGSSANLGPGFDVLAVALDLELDLTVREADEFVLKTDDPTDRPPRTDLCVKAFESVCPDVTVSYQVSVGMPVGCGLGTSAAARVAGLLAGAQYKGDNLSPQELHQRATELEGHPDNVAAAVYGGVVVCAPTDGDRPVAPALVHPPDELGAVLVSPDERVPTDEAREALPDKIELQDAVANMASACRLVLGLERSDFELIAQGLADRIHQPAREPLYQRSMELVRRADEYGALGATISGAGSSVLVWCRADQSADVAAALMSDCEGWAAVRPVSFNPRGAQVL